MRFHTVFASAAVAVLAVLPLQAQPDIKTEVLKHLKTSRDFTLSVAKAMPEADYDFKLTAPQMSFAEQIIHLSKGLSYFLSPFSGQPPHPAEPKSKSKADVLAFVQESYDDAIAKVGALTAEQIAKVYKEGDESNSGADLLIGMLDHCTHHRASAEMYMRAKGITPPAYQF